MEYLEDHLAPAANIPVASDYNDTLKEYAPDGTLVRSLSLGASVDVRDLSVSADSSVNVYTGTFNPVNLHTYSASNLTWSDRTLAGWSTVANVSYGGNAYYNGFVFVTDMSTGPTGTEAAQGIIRFDPAGGTATWFATDLNLYELNIGLDGLLYTFSDSYHIRAYDPNSLVLVRTVTVQNIPAGVGTDFRALAVDGGGNIYIATSGSKPVKLDANGVFQTSLAITGTPARYGLTDIDVVDDGTVIVGSWGGGVIRTTTDLAAVTDWFSAERVTAPAATPTAARGHGSHRRPRLAGHERQRRSGRRRTGRRWRHHQAVRRPERHPHDDDRRQRQLPLQQPAGRVVLLPANRRADRIHSQPARPRRRRHGRQRLLQFLGMDQLHHRHDRVGQQHGGRRAGPGPAAGPECDRQ